MKREIKQAYIYALYDPAFVSKRIYIGKSINPDKRKKDHIKESKRPENDTLKNRWIRKMLNRGIKPEYKILYEVPKNNSWRKAEQKFVAFAKALNIELANSNAGGKGNNANKEVCDKISKSLLKRSKIKPGDIFGKLCVLEFSGVKNHRGHWKCKCSCGKTKIISSKWLLSGKTKSCGCLFFDTIPLRARKRKARSKTGFKGVEQGSRNSFRASIKVNNKHIRLGSFPTAIEAALSYDEAARIHFGVLGSYNFPQEGELPAR
jgi:hypothetical protein